MRQVEEKNLSIGEIPGVGKARYVDSLFLHFELDTLENLVSRLPSLVKGELTRLSERLEAAAADMTDQQRADFYEWHHDDYAEMRDDYLPLLRLSMLFTIYARFEQHLVDVCDRIATDKELKLKLTDMKGSGIVRCTDYLKKVADIDVPTRSAEWSQLRTIGEIRNRYAHAGGVVSDKIRTGLGQVPGASLDEKDRIVIEDKFLKNTLAMIRGFSAELDAALEAD